jgi:hypothetical protein
MKWTMKRHLTRHLTRHLARHLAIAACGLSLAACSSMPSWMQFNMPRSATVATTLQLESEPAGAEARTSLGQTCRTPCSLAVPASEFTVSFTLPGHQPQTVPVRTVAIDPVDADAGQAGGPRLAPNPVFVELQPEAPPPPPAARRRAAPPPQQAARPRPPAPGAMTPQPAPAPAPAPASPWPPVR